MDVAIELDAVSVRFSDRSGKGEVTVFEDLTLEVERGSFTVLLGPSGSGKSTVLNLVDGLLPPSDAKAIRVLGGDIRKQPDVTRQIGYVFQHARLLPWKTLRQNAEFGLRGLGLQPRDKWDDLIERYFRAVDLEEFLDLYPYQVSGGMQQRAAIVRAWVNEPQILLMDEPFSHLDEITAAQSRRELSELWRRDVEPRTVLFVTHDIHEAVELAGRVVMLTKRPASICHDQAIELPYPRLVDDPAVVETEYTLRQALVHKAKVSM